MQLRSVMVVGLALVFCASALEARAQFWSLPLPLNSRAAIDTGADSFPQVTTDKLGNWVAVWHTNDDQGAGFGTEGDIMVSRSTDAGITWTAQQALNNGADTDSGGDFAPQLATDSLGHWVAVWLSKNTASGALSADWDIMFSRSSDNGRNWTDPAPLNTNADTDLGADLYPQIATDGLGTWITVWQSTEDILGLTGTDGDILFSKSIDNGATWTDPLPLSVFSIIDSGLDLYPQIATDSAGHWVVVWRSDDSLGGTIGTDPDILASTSDDNGATWSFPSPLNSRAPVDNPTLATSSSDLYPQIATDGLGTWMAVWMSNDSLSGTVGTDGDVMFARSFDNGATWTPQRALNSNASIDAATDVRPQITTDGSGIWLAVWEAFDMSAGQLVRDRDILYALSEDAGETWTAPAFIATGGPLGNNNPVNDHYPQVATDGLGAWVGVWSSPDDLNGTIDADGDILFSTTLTDVWVDFGFTGAERGSFDKPFNTVLEGYFAVFTGRTIHLAAGQSDETLTIDKPLRLVAHDGTVRIGD